MLYRNLELKANSVIENDCQLPNYILDLEKNKKILQDGKNFDAVGYCLFTENISKEKHTDLVETCHKQFSNPFVTKHTFEKCKKVAFNFDSNSSIDPFVAIGITKDAEGKQPVKVITNDMLKESKPTLFDSYYDPESKGKSLYSLWFYFNTFIGYKLSVPTNSFYLHYPFNSTKMIGFGSQTHHRLGTKERRNDTERPVILP